MSSSRAKGLLWKRKCTMERLSDRPAVCVYGFDSNTLDGEIRWHTLGQTERPYNSLFPFKDRHSPSKSDYSGTRPIVAINTFTTSRCPNTKLHGVTSRKKATLTHWKSPAGYEPRSLCLNAHIPGQAAVSCLSRWTEPPNKVICPEDRSSCPTQEYYEQWESKKNTR